LIGNNKGGKRYRHYPPFFSFYNIKIGKKTKRMENLGDIHK